MREVLGLFSKTFYVNIINNLDFKYITDNVNKLDVKNSGVLDDNLNVENISAMSEDRFVLNKPEFLNLKNIIMKEFNSFNNEYLMYENEFKITTSWFTKTKTGQQSNPHNHRNCMFSGILYIQTSDNSGDIVFNDLTDKRFLLRTKKHNIYNSEQFTFRPKNGMIIIFPSEITHQILKNKSNTDRISLAFNLIPTGDLGYYNSDSFVNIKV